MSLRDQLQAIYVEMGRLTPAVVLDKARPEDHPLHEHFEWDDEVAGEAYRRQQAHELIQSVRVRYVMPDGRQDSVRAFHSIRKEDGYVFVPLEEVVENDMTRAILLRDMEREWKAMLSRYSHFKEFLELVKSTVEAA